MKKLLFLLIAVCSFALTASAARTVKGQVVNAADNTPLIGATVMPVGGGNGTATDVNGNFALSVGDNVKLISFSYVGMVTKQVPVSGNMQVALESTDTQLQDVVVVAYGTQKKESLTGSVSVVDSKKIEKRIGSSVTGALEGSAPGVQVNNTYGEPGAAPSIRIRGIGSLVAGAQSPLYVVDGVPYDGNISDLNPADIESMSVLKDAASSALYGNRAANGVILITTKSGKNAGVCSVNLQVNQGVYTRGIPEYDRMGANQWMETSWTAFKNQQLALGTVKDEASAAAYATSHLIGDFARRNIYDKANDQLFDANGKLVANILPGYDDLDWSKGVQRTGYRQEYSISASASGEKFNVYSSVGYLKENGYIQTTAFERFSGRLNAVYSPNKWFKTGMNINGSVQERNYQASASGSYYANPFNIIRYKAPIYPLYLHNADGSYKYDENGEKIYDTTSDYLDNRNIAYELRADKNYNRRNTLGLQAFATIILPYGFDVTVKGDLNASTTNRRSYNNASIGDGAANGGRLSEYAYQYRTENFQQLLNWNYNFGPHHVDAMLGHESYAWEGKAHSGMKTTMSIEGILTLGNFLNTTNFIGSDDEDKTESYLGRARYNYAEKYFGEVSFRRDGSSRFYKDNRWGNFFSAGASWMMSREDFIKDIEWIDNLKLRASYGEVGNNAGVGLYGYMALYDIDKNGGSPALIKNSLAANDIKWETTQTIDVALEGRLFNRMNFSLGYFDKRSKDLLFQVRLPLSAGSYPWGDYANPTIYKNIGTISNSGVEFSADVDAVRTRDLIWNVGVDATFLHNNVVKLPNHEDILHGSQKYSEGHSAYEFWTYNYEGVDQMTGKPLYTLDPDQAEKATAAGKLVSINGKDYTTSTTYGLRDWCGTALPTVYGSFNTSLRYKDFTLSALFTYSIGGKVMDSSYSSLMSPGASGANAYHVDLLGAWSGVPAGMTETSADRINPDGIPGLNFNNFDDIRAVSDRWLTSASYFVFKNINFSYSLPKNFLHKLQLQGATVSLGAENLFTMTGRKGMNPQYSFSGGQDDTYVTARVYNIGLNLKF